ncbi:MAG: SDR family NAD(P)-dependent oxidoreductase [Desmonostoc vinosum HA7617-LM4]|jgi:NAD(P)-dependent dehydrogenase (short-subunit alcohol dehydrogenase family)|nr:SDR family NAD(P)-dependent oxidoreductase [Desmonostoc vinosum HA7617-LM4]
MSFIDEVNHFNVLIVGASQGIGFGFVKKLLQDDKITKIYATYRHLESATDLIALANQHSDLLICLSMDITEESQIIAAIQQIRAQERKLHLVINCVGLLGG